MAASGALYPVLSKVEDQWRVEKLVGQIVCACWIGWLSEASDNTINLQGNDLELSWSTASGCVGTKDPVLANVARECRIDGHLLVVVIPGEPASWQCLLLARASVILDIGSLIRASSRARRCRAGLPASIEVGISSLGSIT